MSRIIINLLYASVCLLLLLICSLSVATDVYVSRDNNGHLLFSDSQPPGPYQRKHIEIENNYPWADVPAFRPTGKRPRKRHHPGKQKRYTMTELKNACHAARGKYNAFRTSSNDLDWNTYRAKLERYKAARDKWCSRLLRGH